MQEQILINSNNSILKNHLAYGRELLPGLAYIDILYQIFSENGYDYTRLELCDLAIYNPLTAGKGYDIMLDISCIESKDGEWQIRIDGSQSQNGVVSPDKKLYITARMVQTDPAIFEETLDFHQMKQSARNVLDIEKVYERCRSSELVHTGIMKTEGNIYEGETYAAIDISLGKNALSSAEEFMFHPALIDGSSVGASIMFPAFESGGQSMFLPLFYQSFRASNLIQKSCVTRIQTSSVQVKNELLHTTLEFFNEQGKKVAHLEKFTSKLVRKAKMINPDREDSPQTGAGLQQHEKHSVQEVMPVKETNTSNRELYSGIEDFIRQLLAERLEKPVEEIEAGIGYYEMGLDSPGLLELVRIIETKIGAGLSPTLLFEYATVSELAAYLGRNYGSQFDMLGTERIKTAQQPEDSASRGTGTSAPDSVSWPYDKEGAEERTSKNGVLASQTDEIAIIGISGRYPEAENVRELWNNLKSGRDCITEIPKSRWDWRKFEEIKSLSGKSISRWGGFIKDPDCFDPQFFRISPREAEIMDPQERLFLESCWETMEDAGYTPGTLVPPHGPNNRRRVGVFAGVMHKDYTIIGSETLSEKNIFPLTFNYAAIANRVSYFCNFHGPSIAVDTVCSSSLTAMHLALESIRHGECEAALVGGVNLSLHPNKYVSYGIANMHSSDGYCHTFGKGGDGYVSADGVGAVLLKPLRKAIRDKDNIYAVIKGSAINHGGTVSGMTVPSPVAQADMIVECIRKSGVDPRTISYIEAHGTGTSLGDPIEIQGLVKAFENYTKDRQFCSIGSLKSNMGHAESAAGIAGLTKAALQLYYKTLVPSLHSEELNPYIDFEHSPFYVQHKTDNWERPVIVENGQEVTYPLRAGVSSFGAFGANAHIILEEYIPSEPRDKSSGTVAGKPGSAIIPLSARNKERLMAYAGKLLDYLKGLSPEEYDGQSGDVSLESLAYTLQVGREAMEERVAFAAGGIGELIQKLEAFLEDRGEPGFFYQGQVRKSKDAPGLLEAGMDLKVLIDKWTSEGTIEKLGELWVKGLDMNWNMLYPENRPGRLSLPTYPFARESYWVPADGAITERTGADKAVAAYIHPLLHQNTSDFYEQRYTSTFTGEEFFLADHTVNGRRVLPGVAYLEMAQMAVYLAEGAALREAPENISMGIKLKDVVWIRPVIVGDRPAQIHIGLLPEYKGDNSGSVVSYEIYGMPEDAGGEPVIYSQGKAAAGSVSGIPRLDIKAMQAGCGNDSLSSAQLYEAFRSVGIDYGPGHMGVEKVYIGQGEVFARLSLPSSLSGTTEQFVLHPSLMDSALQASIGLMKSSMAEGGAASFKPYLPFALEEMEIFSPCVPSMWAYVRYSEGGTGGGREQIQKLDIDLCDENGKVCVRMKGFSNRMLDGELNSSKLPGERESLAGTIVLSPVWHAVPAGKDRVFPTQEHQVVIVGGDETVRQAIRMKYSNVRIMEIEPGDTIGIIAGKLEACGVVDHILWIAPCDPIKSPYEEILIDGQDRSALEVFKLIKALLSLGYGSRDLGWSFVTTQAQPVRKCDEINPAHASVHGLTGSLAKEYPNWSIRLVDLEESCDWPIEDIFTLPADSRGDAWANRGKQWYRQKLIPVQWTKPGNTLYRPGGVYLVIGGAGGIGEVWSEYMIRSYKAKIVWIGRREKDESIGAKLARLSALGPAPHYIQADAADGQDLRKAYQEIKERFGQLNGVVHSAITLLDQSLANMDEERFKAALKPKIDVSVRMAQVFKEENMDFVMFFSSINSFAKMPGQSNYAAGCTFKDAFAGLLSKEWHCAVKVMNWGYWGSFGVVASKAYRERMEEAGIGSIEPPEAMEALETLLTGPVDQIVLIKTTKPVVLDGVNYGELMAVYPEGVSVNAESMCRHIHEQDMQLQSIKSHGNPQETILDKLLCRLLRAQLESMGLLSQREPHEACLKAQKRLSNLYGRWLEESISVLAENNYLKYDGELCTLNDTQPEDMDAVWREWELQKAAWRENPGMKTQAALAEATMRALPEILMGKRPATDVIFPNSSMALVEGIYKNNDVADYFNKVLADTAAAYIGELLEIDPAARIRILEIGAGTGGTSSMVFKRLQPFRENIQEYCYTDISKAFLIHAEKTYGPENPYLTYRIFNVEDPASEQGTDSGQYDIVIAANVLHATKNIRQTLRNVKDALKRGGLILLNELSIKHLFTHLTFGLLEGWWLYEDLELRMRGCPGLYPETWRKLLENEGFGAVLFPANDAHELGQQIIAAQSNGVVLQKRGTGLTQKPGREKVNTAGERQQLPEPGHSGGQRAVETRDGAIAPDLLREKSIAYIKKLVSEILKIPVNKINSSVPLEEYGIDSILVVQLTNTLRKTLDNITSTLFFEHQTLDDLVDHFIKTQKDSLIKLVGLETWETEKDIAHRAETSAETPASKPMQTFRKPRRFIEFHNQPEVPSTGVQDVAVIGISGRYAGAKDIDAFWENLKAGKNCITEIPGDRWDWREYFHREKGKMGSMYTKWGGFIDDIDKFDPLFFQISPAEAGRMDPQERLFLEAAYGSIEDAGYTPATLCVSRKVGVFVGAMNGNYATGANYWSIANRISYLLNFQGPSMAVDTACSSSLTAVHLALESLYSGISECAVAGGVNLILSPAHYLRLAGTTMLSEDDKCKVFGDKADGFVDGEGVGAVVLKPLQKAVKDRDHIYGIIKGSMLNAGGKTNGYTVPNPGAQSQLVVEALRRTGVNAGAVSYIEAHGTGTALGDPIEIAGLTRAFEQDTKNKQFCAIGSVKSNIGHCESAAGIAGLTKVLLQLKYRRLVPSLHSEIPNPNIDFGNTPFAVQQELSEWKNPVVEIDGEIREYPRIAGISSFGAGGANAHLVVQEYIQGDGGRPKITVTALNPAIIVLSARNEERLKEHVTRLLAAIIKQQFSGDSLADMAYTLQAGREAMEERLAVAAGSVNELKEKLEAFLQGEQYIENLYRGTVKRNKEALAALDADEDMKLTIDAWISKRKYGKLLDLWVKGLNFDWNKLYGDFKPGRISLPTYPFARESYWMERNEFGAAGDGIRAGTPGVRDKEIDNAKGADRKDPLVGTVMLAPVWDVVSADKSQDVPPRDGNTVIFGGDEDGRSLVRQYYPNARVLDIEPGDAMDETVRKLKMHGYIDHILWIAPCHAIDPLSGDAIINEQEQGVLEIFTMIKALLCLGYGSRELYCSIITAQAQAIHKNDAINPAHASVHGLIGSMAKEYPNWKVRLIDTEADCPWPLDDIFTLPSDSQGNPWVYRRGQWYRQKLTRVQSARPTHSVYRPGGVYVVIGGAGGIGEVWSEYMAHNYKARIVWIGRRNKDAAIEAKLRRLAAIGPEPYYIAADASDLEALQRACEEVKGRYGCIHGVVHSAIVLLDQSLANMDEERFRAAIRPKVDVSVRIVQVFQKENPDFVMFFSSMNSFLKAPGQSNYVAGCAFKDAFAHWLSTKLPCAVKVMNWGYWGSVGIVAAKEYRERMADAGMGSIEAPEAMEALEMLLAGPINQIALMKTTRSPALNIISSQDYITFYPQSFGSKIKKMQNRMKSIPKPENIFAQGMSNGGLREKIEDALIKAAAALINVRAKDMDPDMELNEYGFEQVTLAGFAGEINRQFSLELAPVVFLEHPTLKGLAEYLAEEYKDLFEKYYRRTGFGSKDSQVQYVKSEGGVCK